MTFFEVSAQVLPVIFLALVFDQRALLGDRDEGWTDVAIDLVVLSAFAIGEAISLYVLVQNSAFSGARQIVLSCLAVELTGLVVPHAQQRLRAFGERTPWRAMAVPFAIAMPLLFGGALVFLAFGLRAASSPRVETTSLPPPLPPSPPPPPPRPILFTTGGGLRLSVTRWQALLAPRGQIQIKLKVSVRNVSQRRIDVRRPRWLLVVRDFAPRRWTPPQLGAPTYERPRQAKYAKRPVWLVPPNADGAYDLNPDVSSYTFATHWAATVLKAGELYFPSEIKRGVLVYHVTRSASRATLTGVVGLGYWTVSRKLIVVPTHRWGTRTPADAF